MKPEHMDLHPRNAWKNGVDVEPSTDDETTTEQVEQPLSETSAEPTEGEAGELPTDNQQLTN